MPKKRVIKLNNQNHSVDVKINEKFDLDGTIYTEDIATTNGQMDRVIRHLKHLYPQYSEYLRAKDLSDVEISQLYKTGEVLGLSSVYGDPEYGERLAKDDIGIFVQYMDISEEKKKEFTEKLISEKTAGPLLLNLNRACGQRKANISMMDEKGYKGEDYSKLYFAGKEIANQLGMPELFADVDEVDIEEDGKIKKGYLVHDLNGEDFSSDENNKKYLEGDKPLRKSIGKTGEARKALCDMDVFSLISGCGQIDSGDLRFEMNQVNNDIYRVYMSRIPSIHAFMGSTKEEIAAKFSYISTEMAERVNAMDSEKLFNGLIKSGMGELHAEAIVSNLESVKELIKEGEEYYRQNPDAKPDGKHVKALTEEEFEALEYDPKDLVAKGQILGAINSTDFYEFGNGHSSILTPEKEGVEDVRPEILISDKTTKLMDNIVNDKRKTFFGLVSFNNSAEYNDIIKGIAEAKAAEGYDPVRRAAILSDLAQKCKNYSETHKGAVSGSGINRYEMITELYNDLNESIETFRSDYQQLADVSKTERAKVKKLTDMMLLNEGFSIEGIMDPSILTENEQRRYNEISNDAREIIQEDMVGEMKAIADEFSENLKVKFDRLSHQQTSNEKEEEIVKNQLNGLTALSKDAKDLLEIRGIENDIDGIVKSVPIEDEKIDTKAVAIKDKKEEIEDTYVKLIGLMEKDPDLMEQNAAIQEFFHGNMSMAGRLDAIDAYFSDDTEFERNKDNISSYLLYNLVKEEVDKKNPDLKVLSNMFQNEEGYKKVLITSDAASLYIDDVKKTCLGAENLIYDSSKKILQDIKSASSTIGNKDSLTVNAITRQNEIVEERKRAEAEAEERRKFAEKVNAEELRKEEEKLVHRVEKDQKYYENKFGKDSKVANMHRLYRDNVKSEYTKKHGELPKVKEDSGMDMK